MDGIIPNTNAEYIKRELQNWGIAVAETAEVRDDLEMIAHTLDFLFLFSNCVIVCGGLGPTEDDVTREAVAKALGVRLVFNEDLWSLIKSRIESRGRGIRKEHEKMAFVYEEGGYIENPVGLAPALWVRKGERLVLLLPGVPEELRQLLPLAVKSLFKARGDGMEFRIFKTVGLRESDVNSAAREALSGLDVRWGTVIRDGEVWLNVKAGSGIMEMVEKRLREALGENLYGCDEETLEALVGKMLREKGLTLSTAESCTGGLLANLITNISGSSDYFKGGVVSYLEEVKVKLLGVSWESVKEHTVYSHEVAKEMALGVKRLTGSDVSLSTTGIAGPTGELPGKPVGIVYVGLAHDSEVESFEFRFNYDRKGNKMAFAKAALDVLRRYLLRL